MNKQLSEECIKAIEEVSIDKALNDLHARVMASGMRLALTNPSIYTKADLISKEDALGFAEWLDHESPYFGSLKKGIWCSHTDKAQNKEKRYNTEELFNLYINQKK